MALILSWSLPRAVEPAQLVIPFTHPSVTVWELSGVTPCVGWFLFPRRQVDFVPSRCRMKNFHLSKRSSPRVVLAVDSSSSTHPSSPRRPLYWANVIPQESSPLSKFSVPSSSYRLDSRSSYNPFSFSIYSSHTTVTGSLGPLRTTKRVSCHASAPEMPYFQYIYFPLLSLGLLRLTWNRVRCHASAPGKKPSHSRFRTCFVSLFESNTIPRSRNRSFPQSYDSCFSITYSLYSIRVRIRSRDYIISERGVGRFFL